MVYSNFTLESVGRAFELERVASIDLFAEIEPITPSSDLTTQLQKKVPLAVAIGTEKARSELIITIDMAVYTIAQCDKILGILSSMVEQKA